jgi:uncharacterized protein (TIGR02145 family)
MKKTIITLTNLIIMTFLYAQPPEKMSYQTIIRDAGNNLVINQTIGTRVSILHDSSTGMAVYVENQTTTTNANGLLSIEIGSGTQVTGNFSSIDWSNGPYFIKTETDTAGGTNYTITGISQLLSVPYALHAKSAETITGAFTETDPVFGAWNKNYDDLTDKPDLSVFATKNMANQNITNLAKPVNDGDAVNKAYLDGFFNQLNEQGLMKVKDADGNKYNMVIIGSQVWMVENLKTTKFNDGTAIPLVTGNDAWLFLDTPGYCWYNNNKATYGNIYGALYNWYAVNTGKLCPKGWHVPSKTEWTTLTSFLGGRSVAGGKMKSTGIKETGTGLWEDPNVGASNESGFSGLPGGCRWPVGIFEEIGISGNWWSTTEQSYRDAWYWYLDYFSTDAIDNYWLKDNGHSVRCLKDF